MPGHRTTGHRTTRTRMCGHGTVVLCLRIFAQVFPPFGGTGLESSYQQAQWLGKLFPNEGHEMQMLRHQLHFQDLHLGIMPRHFRQCLKHRLAIRRGFNIPCTFTRTRMCGHRTTRTRMCGRGTAQMPQPFARPVRQSAGNHIDSALGIIPISQTARHSMDCFPILHNRYYSP